ncbi:MAG: AmmeMemoRadiSam system protein B [Candidatus Bipolaricaulia bacterium]
MAIRPPYVAGAFYAGSAERLREQIEWCFRSELGPGRIPEVTPQPLRGPVGLVSPHAGYPYSGPVAAHGFSWLARRGRPEAVVIVGTNHTGLGGPISIGAAGAWETPLGTVEIDSALAESILERCPPIEPRAEAFSQEHSVEVQLPFLQYLFGELKFVPLVILDQRPEPAQELGRAIAEATRDRPVVLIASSDFSHYEPQELATRKDRAAIERVLELDLEGFYEVIRRDRTTICGYGAIAAVMEAARSLGLDGKLLRYATSGEATGDLAAVVGYASIAIGGGR